jgi:hypothetical protein
MQSIKCKNLTQKNHHFIMRWTFEMIQDTMIIVHKIFYGHLFHNPHVGCVKKNLNIFVIILSC